jgi:integrin beta 3/collagen type V/XI/XXIV/XXVII alpha
MHVLTNGNKGLSGDKGPTGNKGLIGDKGQSGNNGLSGDKGLTDEAHKKEHKIKYPNLSP